MAYAASYLEARREGYTDSSIPMANQVQLGLEQLAEHLAGLNEPSRGTRWADTQDAAPVPYAHLWMVSPPDNFVGRISIRYKLTAKLLRSGGHLGYEVRPGCRGQGLGHRALQLGVEHLAQYGIGAILLTCSDDNKGSIRIIEAGGGALEDVTNHPDIPGKRIRRYWLSQLDGT